MSEAIGSPFLFEAVANGLDSKANTSNVAASIGNVIAGLLAGKFDPNNISQLPEMFLHIALISIGIGVAFGMLGNTAYKAHVDSELKKLRSTGLSEGSLQVVAREKGKGNVYRAAADGAAAVGCG